MTESLADWTAGYQCTEEENDRIFDHFAAQTDTLDFLKSHRDFVEENEWGMGFRAFHYMWVLLLEDCHQRFGHVRSLEIGVYMGQVISLWGLIAKNRGLDVEISAISPFSGNQPRLRFIRSICKRFSPRYQARKEAGSLYYDDDFLGRSRFIYEKFAGDFSSVKIYKGLSTDRNIQRKIAENRFHIIYVDGDHSFEAASADIAFYAPLIEPGGYLVMDDAAYFLPGTRGFRGYESVARACEKIEPMGFRNILNVGHNRIYQKEAG